MPRRRRAALAAAALLLLMAAGRLYSERFELVTYYPAPSGVYTQLITTGDSFLARDAGKLVVGGMVPSSAKFTLIGDALLRGNVQADGNVSAGGRLSSLSLDTGAANFRGAITAKGAVFSEKVEAPELSIAGSEPITKVVCAADSGLDCSLDKGTLRIRKRKKGGSCDPNTCDAKTPDCGKTTRGFDECKNPCTKSAAACGETKECVPGWSKAADGTPVLTTCP